MAQAKTEVVKPLNEVSIKDINNSKQKIDKWLKDHTHQLVGIDLVASVLGTVPIIGNVMAAIDIVEAKLISQLRKYKQTVVGRKMSTAA